MSKKNTMSRYSDETKKKAVKRVIGGWTYEQAANEAGSSIETACYWTARHFGFKDTMEWRNSDKHSDFISEHERGKTRVRTRSKVIDTASGLPTVEKATRRLRPRQPVATSHKCPHCQGPLEM